MPPLSWAICGDRSGPPGLPGKLGWFRFSMFSTLLGFVFSGDFFFWAVLKGLLGIKLFFEIIFSRLLKQIQVGDLLI